MYDHLSRAEIRQVFFEVWAKRHTPLILDQQDALILAILKAHPEYHAMLEDTAHATTHQQEDTPSTHNPFLHLGLHLALSEQLSIDRPKGIAHIYHTLTQKLGDTHTAQHAMLDALIEQIWQVQHRQRPFNEAAYMQQLTELTQR